MRVELEEKDRTALAEVYLTIHALQKDMERIQDVIMQEQARARDMVEQLGHGDAQPVFDGFRLVGLEKEE